VSAVVAAHQNPVARAFYLQLRSRGKTGTQALSACVRKRIVILNAMIKHQTPWAAVVPVFSAAK
jgi:transposase